MAEKRSALEYRTAALLCDACQVHVLRQLESLSRNPARFACRGGASVSIRFSVRLRKSQQNKIAGPPSPLWPPFRVALPQFQQFHRNRHETPSQRILSDSPLLVLLWPGTNAKADQIITWRSAVEDPHHPRGQRELRSPAEMRKLLNRKIVEQNQICPICLKEFKDYNDIVPNHRDPKGMGGAWRDDHPDNIQATHWWCNGEKGSTRIED